MEYFTTKAKISQPEFLNHLFSNTSGYLELTFIQPPGQRPDLPHIVTESYQLGRERPDWEHVAAMNADQYGVYYSLAVKNSRPYFGHRSKESAAAWVSVLWVDIDLSDGAYPDKDAIYTAICDMIHPATVIIDSGGGLHALWRVTPVRVTEHNFQFIKDVLRGLAVALHGDPSVAELSRVLRLPGTVNTKPERNGARCEIIDWLPGELLLEDFAGYRIPARRKKRTPLVLPFGAQTNLPPFTRNYLEYGAPEGKRSMHLFAAAIDYRANGYTLSDAERDLGGRAQMDGLSDTEIASIIRSGWNSKHGSPNVERSINSRLRGLGGEL